MSQHDPRHRALLEVVFPGAGDRATALAELAGCCECGRELRELELVSDLVAIEAGRVELSADALPPFEAGEAVSRERLLALAERDSSDHGAGPRPQPWPLLLVTAVAAAAIAPIVLRGLLAPVPEPAPARDQLISDEVMVELISPRGGSVARDGLELTWTGELQEGDEFVIRVLDDRGVALTGSPWRVQEARWAPPAEVVAGWPEVVRIQRAVCNSFDDESSHSRWWTVRLAG